MRPNNLFARLWCILLAVSLAQLGPVSLVACNSARPSVGVAEEPAGQTRSDQNTSNSPQGVSSGENSDVKFRLKSEVAGVSPSDIGSSKNTDSKRGGEVEVTSASTTVDKDNSGRNSKLVDPGRGLDDDDDAIVRGTGVNVSSRASNEDGQDTKGEVTTISNKTDYSTENADNVTDTWASVDWNKFENELDNPNEVPNYLYDILHNMSTDEILLTLNNGTMPEIEKTIIPVDAVHDTNAGGDSFKFEIQKNIESKCEPSLKSHKFKQKNKLAIYVPQCILVNRCGGCCLGNNIKCLPVKSRKDIFKVTMITIIRRYGVVKRYFKEEDMLVTIHESCECRCSKSQVDCNSKQVFLPTHCKCKCKEMLKCKMRQRWDHKTCACKCRKIRKCAKSRTFDDKKCICTRK